MNTKSGADAQAQPLHAVREMWAIKHTPSGAFLPAPRGRGGRGGTHVEIGDDGPPRLFDKEASAKSALRYWLDGAITVSQTSYGDPWEGYEYDEDRHLEPKPHRVAEDMKVVRVAICERDE